jgi:hypothetical protein
MPARCHSLVFGRDAIAGPMPDSQDLHGPCLNLKQDSRDAVAFSKEELADFDAQVFRFLRNAAAMRVGLQRVDFGHEAREPASAGGCRLLIAKPAQDPIHVRFRPWPRVARDTSRHLSGVAMPYFLANALSAGWQASSGRLSRRLGPRESPPEGRVKSPLVRVVESTCVSRFNGGDYSCPIPFD